VLVVLRGSGQAGEMVVSVCVRASLRPSERHPGGRGGCVSLPSIGSAADSEGHAGLLMDRANILTDLYAPRDTDPSRAEHWVILTLPLVVACTSALIVLCMRTHAYVIQTSVGCHTR
jgi:hypothetical protein